jgi:hypothetical protein
VTKKIYRISVLMLAFSLSSCADKEESIELFSEKMYKAALSGNRDLIRSMYIPPETYAELILKSMCPSIQDDNTKCSSNNTRELRQAIKKNAAIIQMSSHMFSNDGLEKYYNSVNGDGFKIKEIKTKNMENIASNYKQIDLNVTISTPKNDLLITIDSIILLDGKWKIVEGYKLTSL